MIFVSWCRKCWSDEGLYAYRTLDAHILVLLNQSRASKHIEAFDLTNTDLLAHRVVNNAKDRQTFKFDGVFPPDCTQEQVRSRHQP